MRISQFFIPAHILEEIEAELQQPQTKTNSNSNSNSNSKETAADSCQVGGVHYKNKTIQPWDFIVANNLGFLEGNVIKYVARYKDKHGVEDLKKAAHYLQKLIELHS